MHRGGPAGYLYNLREYLNAQDIKNIIFYNNEEYREEIKKEKKFKKIRKFLKKLKRKKTDYEIFKKFVDRKMKLYEGDYEFVNEYDIIHFHDTDSLYKAKDILVNFKGKVLLTSHCPKTPALEHIEDNLKSSYEQFPVDLRDKLESMERYAFNRADYIVFPCEEAMEPYMEDDAIANILAERKRREEILYIPTGIPLKKIEKNADIFIEKGIEKNNFIVTYVGRHNEVKGYDFLLKFGKEVLERYSDITFVIAGQESEILKPLDNERWIEYGWTNKTYEIIKSSDLFVLPNKKTYFDLILLEVLSMGTSVLMSRTGGNKYFQKYLENSGLFYFEKENLSDALNEFEKIYRIWKENKLNILGEKNLELFKLEFTIDSFGENYLKLLEKVK